MTQASLFNTLGQTRLVNTLSDLLDSDVSVSHKRFGERLGKLVDLSDSFALSDALYYISKLDVSSQAQNADTVIENILSARLGLVQSIAQSFASNAKTRFKFPRPALGTAHDELKNFGPYRRFYLVQQREMETEIQQIRTYTRKALSGMSTKLARIAALDKAMNDTLLAQTGKLISGIPALLEQHFLKTLSQQNDIDSLSWVEQFSREFQAVLLAELEFRLLPIIGMIEALNEEVDSLNE